MAPTCVPAKGAALDVHRPQLTAALPKIDSRPAISAKWMAQTYRGTPASAKLAQPVGIWVALNEAKVSFADRISRARCWLLVSWSSRTVGSTSWRPCTPPSLLRKAKYASIPSTRQSRLHVPSGLFELVPNAANRISVSVTPGTPEMGTNSPVPSVDSVVAVSSAVVVSESAAVVAGSSSPSVDSVVVAVSPAVVAAAAVSSSAAGSSSSELLHAANTRPSTATTASKRRVRGLVIGTSVPPVVFAGGAGDGDTSVRLP